jgi:tetratricopeptide (TPR) repeat protein
MGKICANDPRNTDNLNNYAAMLTMHNAQHLAIPILNNLNKKFPGNSTVLNNLGQAWFGLGEISKAEKYLDSAIRIYAYHPQANITKAAIEESRGNTAKAVEAIKKSIKHAYTNEKEDMLRKHGYTITLKDLRVPFKPDPDPLGLSGFRRPDYPKSISELKSLKPIWESFNNDCDSKLAQLQAERKAIGEKYEKNLSSLKYGVALPLHYKKASLQLNEILANYETKMKKLAELHLALAEDLQKIQQTHKRAAPEAPCAAHLSAENDFIKQYNEKKKANDEQALEVFRHYFNDLAYWSQFTSIDKNQFNLVVLDFQIGWLRKLREYQPLLHSEFENLECAKDEDAQPGKLSDFDVVACNYNDTMDLKVITFYQNCSRMTSKLNLKFVEYTRYDNFTRAEGDTYVGSTIKVSVEKGFDELKGAVGPVKVEAKVGASIEMEFDREGIKDIILGLEAKAGAGHNLMDDALEEGGNIGGKDLIDNTVEIGVEGRISILSGKGSIKGSGVFENITVIEW